MNSFSGIRILIVEDNAFNAKVTSTILNNYGYQTEIVMTGEEAIAKIRDHVCLDLILMDIELGDGMDGAQTTRTIQQFSDVPVVFLTAHTERSIMEKIRSMTAYGSVAKGSGEHVLISAVEIALRLYRANSKAKLYQEIYENSLHELYLFQPERLTFLTVNRGARENLGYTSEELSIMPPLDINLEFDVQSFRKLLEPLLRGEQKQITLNTVHRRKDGSHYPVEVNVQMFEHHRQKVCTALISDLTNRLEIENELKEKATMLNAIVSTAWDAVIMIDERGTITFWNQAAEQLFGYTEEEILGQDLHRYVVADEQFLENVQLGLRHFQSTGEGNAVGKTIEARGRRKDGQEIDVELSLSAIRLNEAWQAVGIVRNIGERKRAEEILKSKNELMHMMLQAIPNPAWLITQDRHILVQNEAAKVFGASEGKYCWQSIHDLKTISPTQREVFTMTGQPLPGTKCYFCLADKVMGDMTKENCEMELDGVIWDIWWVPVDVNTYLHYLVDVTKYKKMEEELYLLAITDPLTQAYNRRYFMQRLEQELERTKRSKQAFSIIMADLDHFKNVNDRFGHASGDYVLKSFVELIQQRIRKTDTLARWGGEEFILLLPETPREKAVDLAEELRSQLSNLDIPGIGKVTVSFGVVDSCEGDTEDSIVMRADKVLYEAKSGGRNCVRSSREC